VIPVTIKDIVTESSAIVGAIAGICVTLFGVWKGFKAFIFKYFNIKIQSKKSKAIEDLKCKTECIEKSIAENKIENDKKFKEQEDRMFLYFDGFKTEIKGMFEEEAKARVDGQERTQLIFEGITASLMCHHANGANGTVSPILKKIEEYKNKKACQ
jgi:hypothetical protein